ncbi:MAG TPA: hypothetical protein VF954_06575 [Acidimicrobiales bacterium]
MKFSYLAAAGVLAASIALPGATALADTSDYTQTPPNVAGIQQTRPLATPATPAVGGTSLPVTGGDLAELAAIGVVATGAGTVLVRRSRRPRDVQ